MRRKDVKAEIMAAAERHKKRIEREQWLRDEKMRRDLKAYQDALNAREAAMQEHYKQTLWSEAVLRRGMLRPRT